MMEEAPKLKRQVSNYRSFGRSFMAFLGFVICSISWIGIMTPNLDDKISNFFLPRYCDETLFADILANPPASIRVIKDLYSRTRLIAVDDEGLDICSFASPTHMDSRVSGVSSPNKQYVVFGVGQTIGTGVFDMHFYIVNATTGTYAHFTLDNPEESVGLLLGSWSPDSSKIAFSSYSNWRDYPAVNTYLNLINTNGDFLWRLDLGNNPSYRGGYAEWTDDGEEILYGSSYALDYDAHEDVEPYWCSVKLDGTGFACEQGARP
jgi:hypothetical protein